MEKKTESLPEVKLVKIRKKLPSSLRKFIRLEKARIRRESFGQEKQEEVVRDLMKSVNGT